MLNEEQLAAVCNFRQEVMTAFGPAISAMHFLDSPTPETSIAQAGTYVKAANGSELHLASGFSMSADNRLRWDGEVPVRAVVMASLSFQCASNNQSISFVLAKNGVVDNASQTRTKITTGTDERNAVVLDHPTLKPGDYIELWLTNNTSTGGVTVTHCHFIVLAFYP